METGNSIRKDMFRVIIGSGRFLSPVNIIAATSLEAQATVYDATTDQNMPFMERLRTPRRLLMNVVKNSFISHEEWENSYDHR